ncbi:hypothetical protein, partial [Verminephrobacter aporrectodeae]|uniref:hypothetical protein n=1 Tax=Verminephrobacter aporrectodeae TaxID=1110389 RepID=UPI0034DAC694
MAANGSSGAARSACRPQDNWPRTACKGQRCANCSSSCGVPAPAAMTTVRASASTRPWSSSACQAVRAAPPSAAAECSTRCSSATRQSPCQRIPGRASSAATMRAGRSQPACLCQHAVAWGGSRASASAAGGAGRLQSAPGPSPQWAGRPPLRCSSTPQQDQSSPARSSQS